MSCQTLRNTREPRPLRLTKDVECSLYFAQSLSVAFGLIDTAYVQIPDHPRGKRPLKGEATTPYWTCKPIVDIASNLVRIFNAPTTKFTRSMSEPYPERDEKENEPNPDAYLTVQSLTSFRDKNKVTGAAFAFPSTLRTIPEVPRKSDESLSYLSNRSIISIDNGREVRTTPGFLQQFEISRRGSIRSDFLKQDSLSEEATASTETVPKRSRIRKVVGAVLSKHRLIGLRHILLALVLALYAIAGMFIFYAIEGTYERQNVPETRDALNEAMETLAKDFEGSAPDANLSFLLKKAYITLIKIDGKYAGSTFYKLEERDYPLWTWTYGTSFFFAFTLYSTVGYGSIAPSTDGGRVAVIFYTAIGFPLALVIIRDVGAVTMVHLTRLYMFLAVKIRNTSRCRRSSSNDDVITIPILLASLISLLCILITAVFVMVYDGALGPEPGLDYFHALYFTFLSHTAVGLGDVMPVNYPHAPLVAIVLLSCMPLMRVINRVLYVGMERRVYGAVALVENSLDRIAP
ncbi:hypothetical protein PRIPAC_71593 [Pristionchus pacificus]|uniref:Ion channel n=1 Tax=Pristionchus pacificus TaxID=54126 RepID=A0A2A6BRN0_PRIPA|nr:hypothetical protein PRIPAC_71593 [Pristionchus pacificus]|eukprot:PDM68560.1 ion channel [Pristionchus pacificus]